MNISELKTTFSLSDALVVGYDDGATIDIPSMTIGRIERDNKFRILKCLHGEAASVLYHSLTDI